MNYIYILTAKRRRRKATKTDSTPISNTAESSAVEGEGTVAGDNGVAMDTSEDKPEEAEEIDLSSESDESDEEDLRLTEEEAKRRQNEKKEKVGFI